jgi:ribosomal protein S4
MTFLRKRSFIFRLFSKKADDVLYDKKKFRRFFRFKKRVRYRVYNINFYKHRKLVYFENRKIIKLFLKKKRIKKQNKLSSYLVNFLPKNSKNILNVLEYKLAIILIKSHFFNNLNDSVFFIKKGFITINNNIIYNPDHVVKLSDVIKINSKYFYYNFYRKSLVNSIFAAKKIN